MSLGPPLRMKEESDTSNDLERGLASCLISPHRHLISTKQESPPHASSSPSSTSASSITSISKVTSSTNGNGTSRTNVPSLSSLESLDLIRAQFFSENFLAASALAASGLFHPAISPEHQNLLLMQGLPSSVLSSTNSTRSKSSSSDGSNGNSPISSLSMSKSKSKSGPKARSPSTGPVASSTGNREKVFVCQICNRSFGYKHVLQNHERTHTGEKPFECRECHKRFTRDHHLKTHMRLHTGEKPYHCSHCDRQFVQVANLRRHLRVHTGEKPYACELCTSRFSDSNQLKAHMLIHKGEKPFQCKKCDGRFRRRHHLMHHKCPKDEANLGKPRRGRRPKAYDQLHSASPSSLTSSRPGSADELLAHHLPLLSTNAAVSSTTSNASTNNNFYHHGSKHHLPHIRSPPPHHLLTSASSLPPTAHFADHNMMPKSRRKPRHTNRILPGSQHGNLFEHDEVDDEHGDIQTQPLNLSISPALTVTKQLASHLSLNARRVFQTAPDTADDDVLDLSRSRSDAESEPEPIEEDEEDEDLTAKEDEMDEVVMMHQKSLENGADSVKRRAFSFSKHYSNNHINNNNNHFSNKPIFPAKLQNKTFGLNEKALDNGNGLTTLELVEFSLSQLNSLKKNGASGLKSGKESNGGLGVSAERLTGDGKA